MKLRSEVLRTVNLGNSVAEYDTRLVDYFVRTAAFTDFVEDRRSIVSGDKGAGKTAIYQYVSAERESIPALADVMLVPAFDFGKDPFLYELTTQAPLTEDEYRSFWKAFLLSLVGNRVLRENEGDPISKELRLILDATGLLQADIEAISIFRSIKNKLSPWMRPEEASGILHWNGIPVVEGKIVPSWSQLESGREMIPYRDAFEKIDDLLDISGRRIWVFIDRLDEAFQGSPQHEIPALRGLLRAYLDLLPAGRNGRVGVKLFVRNDLFRRIIAGGFVNLTHVNATRYELSWEEPDLLNLLVKRLLENNELMDVLGCDPTTVTDDESRRKLFYTVFPERPVAGANRSETWRWMMTRIADGQGARPPRNLIDLVSLALEEQIAADERNGTTWTPGSELISGEALERGLAKLSRRRVEDTLLAENEGLRDAILAFENGKAEHSKTSLGQVLGEGGAELNVTIRQLEMAGLFEKSGSTWKIPFLYRDGLSITQGKAFDPSSDEDIRTEVAAQEFKKRWRQLTESLPGKNDPISKRKAGPKAALEILIDVGYLSQPRTMRQLIEFINQQVSIDFGPQPVSGALARLVTDDLLIRGTARTGMIVWYQPTSAPNRG